MGGGGEGVGREGLEEGPVGFPIGASGAQDKRWLSLGGQRRGSVMAEVDFEALG